LAVAERVRVVAPHPDYEAIACGGAICLRRRDGARVRVTFLTSGESGPEDVLPEPVRSIREADGREAAEVLGVEGSIPCGSRTLASTSTSSRGRGNWGRSWEPTPADLIYPHRIPRSLTPITRRPCRSSARRWRGSRRGRSCPSFGATK
jgi:hypothetical protein